MPNSSRVLGVFVLTLGMSGTALAQRVAQGFSTERFYPSAPTGGWLIMDDIDIHGRLGGALSLTLGYAANPLRIGGGAQGLDVVSDQAFADVGAALTYGRWRFYVNFVTPLVISGESGMLGGYSFTGPGLDPGSNPDVLSDARIGTDVRIFGRPGGRFRFGAGAQLFIPFGERRDYDTDGDFRGMVRLLFAGDARYFKYAAQLGVHIRPLDDSATPGSPRGSELLFGFAAGANLPLGRSRSWAAIVGPEIYGASSFRAFFSGNATALEMLLSGRFEGTRDDKLQMRVKLGVGAGLPARFGAPDWRIVAAIEMFNHNSH